MANSLQEQLLKAGLVSEQQLRDAKAGKRRARKRGDKPAGAETARAAERERERRREADRQRNLKIEADRERKALRRRIRDLVIGASLNVADAERGYSFVHGKRVKRIYVTPEQQRDLAAGTLAITVAGARHHVVPAAIADQVRELDAEYFVHRSDPQAAASDPDDEFYAAFQVPDDLEW